MKILFGLILLFIISGCTQTNYNVSYQVEVRYYNTSVKDTLNGDFICRNTLEDDGSSIKCGIVSYNRPAPCLAISDGRYIETILACNVQSFNVLALNKTITSPGKQVK